MSALKDILEDAASRAKVYDVTQLAWTAGRRRRRLRYAAGSGVVAAAVGAVIIGLTVGSTAVAPGPAPQTHDSTSPSPSGPPAVTACVVEKLEMPWGYPEKSALSAGDPTGRFHAGRAYPTDNRDRLLIWDNGKVKTLPGRGEDSTVTGINRHGTAVITGLVDEKVQSWVYRGNQMMELKGTSVHALGLNDSDVVIGTRGEVTPHEPIIWRSLTAEPQALPLPGPRWSGHAVAINSAGYVFGHGRVNEPESVSHALIWAPDGTLFKAISGSKPDYHTQLISLYEDTAYLTSRSPRSGEAEYWRVDLRTGLTAKLPWTDATITRVAKNGLLLTTFNRVTTVVSGSTRVSLPDVPGHVRGDPASYEITVVTAMSTDGLTFAGYQSIGTAATPSIAAVRWRCH